MAIGERAEAPADSATSETCRSRWRATFLYWLRTDWQGERVIVWGAALLIVTAVALAMYYAATPAIVRDPDTPTYLNMARNITHGKFIDTARLPVYPLFIDLVYLFAGAGNLAALTIAQGWLFIIATMGVYALGYAIFQRAWMAFFPALLIGTNTHVMSFVKPILTEALTLFWVTALGLTLAWYALRPSPRRLWLVAGVLTLTFMTRPEWVYFPVPLLLFMLLLAWRAGDLRRLAAHAAGALAAMYAVAVAYMIGNEVVNRFFGFTDVQAINLLAKVIQYRLTSDPPSQYAALNRLVVACIASGSNDPLTPIRRDPTLASHHYAEVSGYAMTMIVRHLPQFMADSWGHDASHTLQFAAIPPHPASIWVPGAAHASRRPLTKDAERNGYLLAYRRHLVGAAALAWLQAISDCRHHEWPLADDRVGSAADDRWRILVLSAYTYALRSAALPGGRR